MENTNALSKSLELANNVSRLAANLSSGKPKHEIKKSAENTNQPHTQTVEVKVGEQGQQKPVVVHEKKETHIHKPYPDNRNLTTEECEVEKLRIQTEADDKRAEREYRMWLEEQNRAERKERQEYERREKERKREEDKKAFRRFGIGAGILTAVGLGVAGYYLYTDSRRPSSTRLAIPAPQINTNATINAEGTVE